MNLILLAHPSKSGSDWWHGTVVRDGKSGFFPKTYVAIVDTSKILTSSCRCSFAYLIVSVKAKALYSYTGDNPDELPFVDGDILTIVDRSEQDWWKAEQNGVVFLVPAAYLEVVDG